MACGKARTTFIGEGRSSTMPTRPHLKGSLPRLTRSFGDSTAPRYCAMLFGGSSCHASAAKGGRIRPGPSRSRIPSREPVSTGSSSSSFSSSESSPGRDDEELEGGGGGSRCPLDFSALLRLDFLAGVGGAPHPVRLCPPFLPPSFCRLAVVAAFSSGPALGCAVASAAL